MTKQTFQKGIQPTLTPGMEGWQPTLTPSVVQNGLTPTQTTGSGEKTTPTTSTGKPK